MFYDQSGKENLRAGQQVFGPQAAPSPGPAGEDVGGKANDRAGGTIYRATNKTTPKGTSNIPAETFNDDAV